MPPKQRGGSIRKLGLLIVLAAAVFAGLALFRVGPVPAATIESDLPGIGKRTVFQVRVAEPKRGLGRVRVEITQGDRTVGLEQREHVPLDFWRFWGDRIAEDELTVEVGSRNLEWLREGPATLRVTVQRAGTWLRSPEPAVQELTLEVKLRPPSLHVLSSATYVTQGGCEAVVYRVGESAVRDGVQAGDWWFPGYPLPGGEARDRFALFGAPYDMDSADGIQLMVADDVGNESQAAFVDRYSVQPLRRDTIRVSDGFLQKVVPAIRSQTPELREQEHLLDSYLEINRDLRKANNAELIQLAAGSKPDFLWHRNFMQMRNAKVMSDFADRRIYTYKGQEVDRQDHLGFDLASVRNAPITAANAGTVVLARYFGIYGNAVVIDHGYGLMSLYGHLSSIAIEPGQQVERGQVVGRSGETGLAGGDHLHFTMLLQGLPVNPREWWDGHWIRDRLELKLGEAFPFDG